MHLIATAAFGLEAVVARELAALGYEDTSTTDGRIAFETDAAAVARCNLWLRSANRVLIRVADFPARDFDELFEGLGVIDWREWLPADAAFPVTVGSRQSALTHTPSCQSVAKKAVVEALRKQHNVTDLPETGPTVPISISLHKDVATVALDTSGEGLHRRGYRTQSGSAPLRETLAAALVQLSVWNRDRPFMDPCCGSGTIAIEAALLGRNVAPGIHRDFVAEAWNSLPESTWTEARTEAQDLVTDPFESPLLATDIAPAVLRIARENAARAGVADDIHFQHKPLAEASSAKKYGVLITNPPYGERLGDAVSAGNVNRQLSELFDRLENWSYFVLAADRGFDRAIGRKATRRRKLYNGTIECTYHQFLGPRPPRRSEPESHTIDSRTSEYK